MSWPYQDRSRQNSAMLNPTSLLAGFGLSAALIVAIGAQNAFVLRQGLRREHVGPIVVGCALIDLALIAAGVAGLGAVLGQAPRLTAVLGLGGAVFLAWNGAGAIRRALRVGDMLAVGAGDEALSLGGALLRMAGFTLLNPHVYLDTVLLVGAVGAVQPAGGKLAFVIGAGLASASWFVSLGYGARLLAPLFRRPAAWRVLDLVVGVTMLAIAAGLVMRAFGQLHALVS